MAMLRQVRSDLKEIRYYYSKRDMFESASKKIIESGIVEKVSRYNRAMTNAPPRLYEAYYFLYVSCLTQTELSEKYQCSLSFVKRLNGQLCSYLAEKIENS